MTGVELQRASPRLASARLVHQALVLVVLHAVCGRVVCDALLHKQARLGVQGAAVPLGGRVGRAQLAAQVRRQHSGVRILVHQRGELGSCRAERADRGAVGRAELLLCVALHRPVRRLPAAEREGRHPLHVARPLG
eukprot:CAMPEP_0185505228 /NCGR_PEP_ID=MMETSP1366-20130426/36513_1 /TAXON_ID=38817 /ORGANISM="Gephyrocapsa oceanica, Strain RCC1303" /LENGTH=135 /DNA_ID=CAMNT_0028115281 /DNA_START=158 /DNA_END=562 /DNA_ORIENTATION=+